MKKQRDIAKWADIIVLCLVVLLNPLTPFCPYQPYVPPHIPDKLEIHYRPTLDADSLHNALQNVENEMEEMRYYFRVHNINDEGFHLVARYHIRLQEEYRRLKTESNHDHKVTRHLIKAKDRLLPAVKALGGYWRAGRFHTGKLTGKGIARDSQGRIVCGLWNADTIVTATRADSQGIYRGQMDVWLQACGEGVMDEWDGCHKEGFWQNDRQHGFGFDSSPQHQLRIGEWKEGRFLGEKLRYTAERIYGIDISRHQHEKGRKRYGINWRQLRITSLGHRHNTEGRTYPVSFIYIKSTEGTTIRNRYYVNDYRNAHAQNISVGAYHFFSLKSSPAAQADFFLKNTIIRPGDFPPVLDVEPSEAQIEQIGEDELMRRIRIFMEIVESRTGKRPILYVNQMFINKHMTQAADIKQKYNVWIARYNQYKPDVKLIYWQLCPDGRVNGITGEVDINVFNGYQGAYEEFKRNVDGAK
jgi:lysozyme